MKKIRISIAVVLFLVFMGISHAQASAIGVRDIDNQTIQPGESTNVSIVINNTINQALSLHEILPAGWNLTRISDDANAFRHSTNEWVWFNMTVTNKTVTYRLSVPANASTGSYYLNGSIINSTEVVANITGESLINLLNITKGDFNNDGRITLYDVIYLLNVYAQTPGYTLTNPAAGDFNGDSRITLYDVIYLLNVYAGTPGYTL